VNETNKQTKTIDEWFNTILALHGENCLVLIQFDKGIPSLISAGNDGASMDRISSRLNYMG